MGLVTSANHTPPRSFRIPDDVYLPALRKAQSEGRSLTAVVVAGLEEYIEDFEQDDSETPKAPRAR